MNVRFYPYTAYADLEGNKIMLLCRSAICEHHRCQPSYLSKWDRSAEKRDIGSRKQDKIFSFAMLTMSFTLHILHTESSMLTWLYLGRLVLA